MLDELLGDKKNVPEHPFPSHEERGSVSVIIGFTVLVAVAITGVVLWQVQQGDFWGDVGSLDEGDLVACTLEAKLCPDGTSVGRSGPNCEFTECFGEIDSSDWQTYRNEELGFELIYPSHFEPDPVSNLQDQNTSGEVVYFRSNNSEDGIFSVSLLNQDIYEDGYIDLFVDIVPIENAMPVTLGGRNAFHTISGDGPCRTSDYRVPLDVGESFALRFIDCGFVGGPMSIFEKEVYLSFKFLNQELWSYDPEAVWVQDTFPESHRGYGTSVWRPRDWIFNCCDDRDSGFGSTIGSSDGKLALRIWQPGLIGCVDEKSRCGIDEIIEISASKFFDAERQRMIEDSLSYKQIIFEQFEKPAVAFVGFNDVRADATNSLTYLIQTGTDVIRITFYDHENMSQEFIDDFLSRLGN